MFRDKNLSSTFNLLNVFNHGSIFYKHSKTDMKTRRLGILGRFALAEVWRFQHLGGIMAVNNEHFLRVCALTDVPSLFEFPKQRIIEKVKAGPTKTIYLAVTGASLSSAPGHTWHIIIIASSLSGRFVRLRGRPHQLRQGQPHSRGYPIGGTAIHCEKQLRKRWNKTIYAPY